MKKEKGVHALHGGSNFEYLLYINAKKPNANYIK